MKLCQLLPLSKISAGKLGLEEGVHVQAGRQVMKGRPFEQTSQYLLSKVRQGFVDDPQNLLSAFPESKYNTLCTIDDTEKCVYRSFWRFSYDRTPELLFVSCKFCPCVHLSRKCRIPSIPRYSTNCSLKSYILLCIFHSYLFCCKVLAVWIDCFNRVS